MQIKPGFLALSCCIAATTHAAQVKLIWQEEKPPTSRHFVAAETDYQWRALPDQDNAEHQRYQLYYRNIPVWGQQQIKHQLPKNKTLTTGMRISGLEQDLSDLSPAFSLSQAKSLVEQQLNQAQYLDAEQVIFIDDQQKAHLAWHLNYIDRGKQLSMPEYLIDAQEGRILKQWNAVHQEAIGQGLGGNDFALPYRPGRFQHGDIMPGIPSLGRFEVKRQNHACIMETPYFRIINLDGIADDESFFPVFNLIEHLRHFKAYRYDCSEASRFINDMEYRNGTTNHSYSVMNDTMYFATQTYEMYEKFYKVKAPLGKDLPMRAYTHIAHLDNAAAIPTIKLSGVTIVHQQIVIGDGNTMLTAATQSVIAHELSHNFTRLHSNLVYEGQSGGLNESFSDMAAFAMMDYLRMAYPWYWDGKDWSLGREAMIGGMPIRYMDDPTKDGKSIGHMRDYHKDLNVHYSSGIFNKAFYHLATSPGWTVRRAFQVMLDANMHYWTPNTSFEAAACGVIQAAKERRYNKNDVIKAFNEVGLTCPMKL